MRTRDLLPIAVVLALLACLPLVTTSNTVLNFLILALIVTLAAQGWNVLGGYGGQSSFGHAAFFGTGAYLSAILQSRYGVNAWAGFVAGSAAGGLVGWSIGYLSFRSGLRGSYFALVTLAFAEVFRILANAADVTGGAAGLLLKLDLRPENFQFPSKAAFYWVALALVGAAMLLSRWIERSRFGMQLIALRENEDAARALGVNVLRVKLGAITLSGTITAAAGAFYMQYFLYVDANVAYGTWISIEALLAPIVGGVGLVFGPLVGALTLHGLGELTKLFAGRVPGIDLATFGAALVLTIAFAPKGLLGLASRVRRRIAPAAKRRPAEA